MHLAKQQNIIIHLEKQQEQVVVIGKEILFVYFIMDSGIIVGCHRPTQISQISNRNQAGPILKS
jgi:hypothetical protein